MKCPKCGNREFQIVSYSYETVTYDDRGYIVKSSIDEGGDIVEEEGYHCISCDKTVKSEDMIRHEYHIEVI